MNVFPPADNKTLSKKQRAQNSAREKKIHRVRLERQRHIGDHSPVNAEKVSHAILVSRTDKIQAMLPTVRQLQGKNYQAKKQLLLPEKPLQKPWLLLPGKPAQKKDVSWIPVVQQDIHSRKGEALQIECGNVSTSVANNISGDRSKVRSKSLSPSAEILNPRLNNELWQFFKYVSMRPEEELCRQIVVEDIRSAICAKFPGAVVSPFGSYASALSIFSSDVDLTVLGLGADIDEEGKFKESDALEERSGDTLQNAHESSKRTRLPEQISDQSPLLRSTEAISASPDIEEQIDDDVVSWGIDTNGDVQLSKRARLSFDDPMEAPTNVVASESVNADVPVMAELEHSSSSESIALHAPSTLLTMNVNDNSIDAVEEQREAKPSPIALHARPWHQHSDNGHSTLRLNITSRVFNALFDPNTAAAYNGTKGELEAVQLRNLAINVEDCLFHAAETRDIYADYSTLTRRIEILNERGILWLEENSNGQLQHVDTQRSQSKCEESRSPPTLVSNASPASMQSNASKTISLVETQNKERTWHTETSNAHKTLRDNVLQKVFRVLLDRQGSDALDEKFLKNLPDKAMAIEDLLFKGASSRNEYADYLTLRQRIDALGNPIEIIEEARQTAGAANDPPPPEVVVIDTGNSKILSSSIANRKNSLYAEADVIQNSSEEDDCGDSSENSAGSGEYDPNNDDDCSRSEDDVNEKSAEDSQSSDDSKDESIFDRDAEENSGEFDDSESDDEDIDIGIHVDDDDCNAYDSEEPSAQSIFHLNALQRAENNKRTLKRKQQQLEILRTMYSLLQRMAWNEASELRSKARVPIVTLMHRSGISCDISLGVDSDELTVVVRELIHIGKDAFFPLCSFLKVFLNQLNLDKPFNGGIGSYRLYVMVAYVLSLCRADKVSGPTTDLGYALSAFLVYFGKRENLNPDTVLTVGSATVTFVAATRVIACQKTFERAGGILREMLHSSAQNIAQPLPARERQSLSSSLLATILDAKMLQKNRNAYLEKAMASALTQSADRCVREKRAEDVLVALQKKLETNRGNNPCLTLAQVRSVNPALVPRLESFLSVKQALAHLDCTSATFAREKSSSKTSSKKVNFISQNSHRADPANYTFERHGVTGLAFQRVKASTLSQVQYKSKKKRVIAI